MAIQMDDSEKKETRKRQRIPLGAQVRSLHVDWTNDAYVPRWINDMPGRIARAQQGGYEFATYDDIEGGVGDFDLVNEDSGMGDKISRVVSKRNGMRAYLMKIRKEWYEEDQKAKQKPIDDFENDLRRGQDLRSQQVENRYVPKGGMKITRGE